MATYNNKHWLLSHIRNSFISTDDTGISELVMNSDDLAKNLSKMYLKESWVKSSHSPGSEKSIANETCFYIYPDLHENDDEGEFGLSQSFDINFTQDLPFYRFRTNTEAKLVKLSDIKKKQCRIIKVDDSVVKFNQEIQDNDELFIRKDLTNISNEVQTSRLTHLLESLPQIKLNKFREFSTLDGSSFPSHETKTIQVFITPLKELRDYPIKCCVHSNAKIEEFIGYILFLVVNQYPDYSDNLEDAKTYGLFISDESGEADYDFPPLGLSELISKYQFQYLALAKRLNTHFQNRTLSVASDTTTMIYPVKRQASIETNKSLPTNIRQNENAMTVHDSMFEAPLYNAFRVTLITKKHFRTEVQLGISSESVEIDPLQQKSSKSFFKQKSVHFSIDAVAFCEITSKKTSRFEFRIAYAYNPMLFDTSNISTPSTSSEQTPSTYTLKYNTFETDPKTAEQIVQKVNNILMLRTSSVRRDYLNRHDKIKKSFIRKKKYPI